MIVILHEYGHGVNLLNKQKLRQKENPTRSYSLIDIADMEMRDEAGASKYFPTGMIHPTGMSYDAIHMISIRNWFQSASVDAKMQYMKKINPDRYFDEISESEVNTYYDELMAEVERDYQNLQTEIFPDLFAGYALQKIPVAKALFDEAQARYTQARNGN